METSSSCGAWGKRVSPLPTAWGPWSIPEWWDMVAQGSCTGCGLWRSLSCSLLWAAVRRGRTDWPPPSFPPFLRLENAPPSPVPGLRKPHNLTSHSLPRRSFVFFPSRGFLWGWALWGYSFLLGRGCVVGKGPSSAFCPSEPLEPTPQHRTPAALSVTSPGEPQSPQTTIHPWACPPSRPPGGLLPISPPL